MRAVVALDRGFALEGLGHRPGQFHVRGVDQVEVLVREDVRQVRSEEVQGQEEGPVAVVRVGGVVLQPLDGAGGQVVLEGGLDRLVQTGGEQVPGAAVREGAADPVADLVRRQAALVEVGEVVRVVDGVVPAGQFGAVEAVVGRGAAVSGVPLAEQAAVVAVFAQRPGEGELVLGEVLQVADVAFVVGEELVPEGCLAGQQAGAGRGADGGGGVPAVEAGSVAASSSSAGVWASGLP